MLCVDLLQSRIQDAISLRKAINLPQEKHNTVYRLVNGEGDRLGGLVVDVLGSTIIIQSSACWVESYKEAIIAAVDKSMNSQSETAKSKYSIVWRQAEARLKQDGYNVTTSSTVIAAVGNEESSSQSDKTRKEIVYENGIKYVVYPESSGQKTGFFCDQRDNRMMIGRYVATFDVLS